MTQPLDVRAHLYRPIVDETGTLATYATVTVFADDGVTKYAGTIYRDEVSADSWPNPFIAAPGLIDVYLDSATRVVLGIELTDGSSMQRSESIDVVADAAKMVTSVTPVMVRAAMSAGNMLSVDDGGTPYWRGLTIAHEHASDQPGTLYLGPARGFGPQDVTFANASVLGGGTGTDLPPSGLADTLALGHDAAASGRITTAVGAQAVASEAPGWPWDTSSVAAGVKAWARFYGVAAGPSADATAGRAVSLGREAFGGTGAVTVGTLAHAPAAGVSIGARSGADSWGAIGSVGLGADAQGGLPSTTTEDGMWSVLLGSHDPRANVVFPWANPRGSQSESPWDEYLPTMAFEAKTVQFQRHFTTVLAGVLRTVGDTTFGRNVSKLSFYGATPQPLRTVGDDEPASGIEALDSLIYALRDLGLLGYRHEALVTYHAADLLPLIETGDDVTSWTEHDGSGRAVSPTGTPPSYLASASWLNDRPAVHYDNGVHERRYGPREVLVGENLVTRGHHVLAVASHYRGRFGSSEGLVNLLQTGAHSISSGVVLQSTPTPSRSFTDTREITAYTRDGHDQHWSFDARPDGQAHVYRVSNLGGWPTASLVLGGPVDAVDASQADYWRGSLASLTVLDDTWPEASIDSMTRGLMFRYGIDDDDWRLRDPALEFIKRQHRPLSGVRIRLDDPEEVDDPAFVGYINGSVLGLSDRFVDIPWVSIWDWFRCYDYWGPLVGFWANLPRDDDDDHWHQHDWWDWFWHHNPWRRYKVMVTVTRKNRVIDIGESEWMFGFCWLEDVGIWTTGCDWVRHGYKKAYLYDTWTGTVLAESGHPSRKYNDIEVRTYSTVNGTLVLQDTSPVYSDDTFDTCAAQPGKKVVRVYRISTGEVLASTEWQDRALPRYTVASRDDPDYTQGLERESRTYDSSVAVMALCEKGPDHYRRARVILSTLVSVMNNDGSINDSYDSLFPVKAAGISSSRSITWFGLALMYYQSITGDSQFFPAVHRIAQWMFNHQHDGLMARSAADSSFSTEDNVSAYFFFQRYSEVIAETGS